MNVDYLVNKYYKKCVELKKNRKSSVPVKMGLDSKLWFWGLIISMTTFVVTSLALVLPVDSLPFSYTIDRTIWRWVMLISFILLIVDLIWSFFLFDTEEKNEKRIETQANQQEFRIETLLQLLENENVCERNKIDDSLIDSLIDNVKKNQIKYDYLRDIRSFVKLLATGIIAIVSCFLALTGFKMSIQTVSYLLVPVILFYIFYRCVYFLWVVDGREKYAKKYCFHESVIDDLTQLKLFKDFYLKKTVILDACPKGDTTCEASDKTN